MKPSSLFHTALSFLLAACLLPVGTRAQTPVTGGTLIVGSDGPVFELNGQSSPPGSNFVSLGNVCSPS